ncbi:hypothetical protein PYCC9005_002709 [Savitreella phatthalungensis]
MTHEILIAPSSASASRHGDNEFAVDNQPSKHPAAKRLSLHKFSSRLTDLRARRWKSSVSDEVTAQSSQGGHNLAGQALACSISAGSISNNDQEVPNTDTVSLVRYKSVSSASSTVKVMQRAHEGLNEMSDLTMALCAKLQTLSAQNRGLQVNEAEQKQCSQQLRTQIEMLESDKAILCRENARLGSQIDDIQTLLHDSLQLFAEAKIEHGKEAAALRIDMRKAHDELDRTIQSSQDAWSSRRQSVLELQQLVVSLRKENRKLASQQRAPFSVMRAFSFSLQPVHTTTAELTREQPVIVMLHSSDGDRAVAEHVVQWLSRPETDTVLQYRLDRQVCFTTVQSSAAAIHVKLIGENSSPVHLAVLTSSSVIRPCRSRLIIRNSAIPGTTP